MAVGTTLQSKYGILRVEDPAVPGTFVKICGATSRSINIAKATQSIVNPDCDDENAIAWEEFDIVSQNWSCNLSGVVTEQALPIIKKFNKSTDPWNIRFEIQTSTGLTGYQGKAFMTSLEHSVEQGARIPFSASLQGTGVLADI